MYTCVERYQDLFVTKLVKAENHTLIAQPAGSDHNTLIAKAHMGFAILLCVLSFAKAATKQCEDGR